MIKNLCHELGVHTEPMRISGVWVAPIYSWYHASFDREPDVPGAPAVEKVMRKHACAVLGCNSELPVLPCLYSILCGPKRPQACPVFPDKALQGYICPCSTQVMVDFHACRWPPHIPSSHDTSIAEYFDNLNEPALSNLAENLEMEEEQTGRRPPLITFSHFLPLQVANPKPCSAAHLHCTTVLGGDTSLEGAPHIECCTDVERHGGVSP